MTEMDQTEQKLKLAEKIAADRKSDVERLTPKIEQAIKASGGDEAKARKLAENLFDQYDAAKTNQANAEAKAAEHRKKLGLT